MHGARSRFTIACAFISMLPKSLARSFRYTTRHIRSITRMNIRRKRPTTYRNRLCLTRLCPCRASRIRRLVSHNRMGLSKTQNSSPLSATRSRSSGPTPCCLCRSPRMTSRRKRPRIIHPNSCFNKSSRIRRLLSQNRMGPSTPFQSKTRSTTRSRSSGLTPCCLCRSPRMTSRRRRPS